MRRIAAVAFGVTVLVGVAAPSAGAVPDPAAAITCLTQASADLTALVDPAALTETPGMATTCLAP
ncbi:hypothetical protein [Streptomyces sp. CRN 30]|uniref:hypothetical protein n=1 Tax=Streptomyces sp. CRN 30 TaxID=3075613 RepID=UPI002A809DB0|nr:hypothetical protein [Streptomyces sp. CRN 30]